MKENLLTEKEMVFLLLLYFHACTHAKMTLFEGYHQPKNSLESCF